MNERERGERDLQARAETPAPKKPYRKPGFLCGRVFETTALSCGKIHSTQGQCHFNRKNS
jgi:hypothetical protein